MSVGQVISAEQNVEVSGGTVEQGARELTLRTFSKLTTAEDFNRVAVGYLGNYVVTVADIGTAVDSPPELSSAKRATKDEKARYENE